MLTLSPDPSFHFELLRILSLARYSGSDVSEVLRAASSITPGSLQSFSSVFNTLALHIQNQASAINSTKNPISARDAYFRASSYFRCADFYLHGDWEDKRITDLWEKQKECFDNAIALLPIPGKRTVLKSKGGEFEIPVIFYAAFGGGKKPTLILGNGYDGAQEEMLHVNGFAALERGYNVITYEGPGQCSVRRDQNLGFIVEWEKVVSPVVDYLETLEEVDMQKVGLVGLSMGGFLAARAAAFESRIKAVIAIDGVYDFVVGLQHIIGAQLQAIVETGNAAKIDETFLGLLKGDSIATSLRWGIEQGLWSFKTRSPWELMERANKMTLEGLVDRIQCPVWVGEASQDMFFKGQPEMVKEALGDRATLERLGEEDAAEAHCHFGALALLNQKVMDWFGDVAERV